MTKPAAGTDIGVIAIEKVFMRRLSPDIQLLLLAVAIATIGVVLTHHGEFWRPMGDALIIASALAVTVDRYIKLRLQHEIARDVFFAALGIHLPTALKEEMLAIGDYKLVRRHLKVTYRLSSNPNPALVNCEIHQDFEIYNFTHGDQVFTQLISVTDAPSGAPNLDPPILSVRGETATRVAYDHVGADIKPMVSVHSRDWRESVTIPAGEHAHFAATTQHVLPDDWEDVFILAEPTIGISVTLLAPSTIAFDVIFDHRHGADAHRDADNVWRMTEAFLPNTLFRVVWRPQPVAKQAAFIDGPAKSESVTAS